MEKLINKIKNRKLDLLIITLLLFCSVPSVISIFHKGFWISDDGSWMVIRFAQFIDSLRDGQIPVRLLSSANHGFGYPTPTFLYPLYLYLGVPFSILGFSTLFTIKILFALSLLLSGLGMYLFLRTRFEKFSSLIGSLFYLYAPYHLFDLTVRGSLGELLSLMVSPFLLYTLHKKWVFASSILTSFLILSHNSLSLLFIPVIYLAVFVSEKQNIKNILKPLLFGIGISSFFWLPIIFELGLTKFSEKTISNPTDYFADINLISIPLLIVFLFSLFVVFKDRFKNKLSIYFLIVGLVFTFFSSTLSTVFWNILPSQFIQFPFRLLSISIFSGSILTAFLLSHKYLKYIIGFTLILLLFLLNNYLLPRGFDFFEEGFYSTNQATTTVQNEYMPKWVIEEPTEYIPNIAHLVSGEVKENKVKSNLIDITVNSKQKVVLTINRIYYPGWNATINGEKAEISYSNQKGLMQLNLNKGTNNIILKFTETPLRLMSDAVSLFSLFSLIYLVKFRKNK